MTEPRRIKVTLADGRVGTIDASERGAGTATTFQPLEAPTASPARVPAFHEPGGPMETFGREGIQAASYEWGDELRAREQAALNKRLSSTVDPKGDPRGNPDMLQRIMDLGQGRTPQVTRGIEGQPLTAEQIQQRDAATRQRMAEDNPTAATAGAVTGAVVAPAPPNVKVAKGASLAKRLGAAVPNVAMDAAGAALMGAGANETGDRLAGAVEGAEGGALVSTGMRAVPGAAHLAAAGGRKAADLAKTKLAPFLSRLRTMGAPEDVQQAAQDFLDLGEKGATLRAAARRAEQGNEQAIEDIAKSVSSVEEHADRILNAKVGMKEAPIATRIAREGVDTPRAIQSAQQAVLDTLDELQELRGQAAGPGRLALNRLLGTGEDAGAVDRAWAAISAADLDAAGAAKAFVTLDHLKREVGRAVRTAGKGQNADANTQEALKNLYEVLRTQLELPQVWGEGAAAVQREVNAAWVPYIRKHSGLSRLVESDRRGLVADDPWETLMEADPRKLAGLLAQAGAAANKLDEQVLVEGLRSMEGISEALTAHYNMPPEIADSARHVAANSSAVRSLLERVIEDSSAMRQLKEIEQATGMALPLVGEAVPSPAKVARIIGSAEAERLGDKVGDTVSKPRALFSEGYPKVTKAAALMTGAEAGQGATDDDGTVLAQEPEPVSLSDRVRQLVGTSPAALGPYGHVLAADPDNFAVNYALLAQTDKDFQKRLRELEQEQDNE